MSDHERARPVATQGLGDDPYGLDDHKQETSKTAEAFTAKPVPASVREEFARTGREMAAKHAAEGMPAPTLRQRGDGSIGPAIEPEDVTRLAYERGRNEMLAELTKRMPQNVEQAAAQAHASLLRWQGLSHEAMAAKYAYTKHDELGGAVRQRCVELLIEGGKSASAAKDAASNHPTYVEHKLKTAELSTARDRAEVQATQAYEALQNARDYLRMWIARSEGGHVGQFVAAARKLDGTLSQPIGSAKRPLVDILADAGVALHTSNR